MTLIRDGDPLRAMMIGRFSMRRPHIRCLDIVYGGLITDGSPEAVAGVTRCVHELLDGDDVRARCGKGGLRLPDTDCTAPTAGPARVALDDATFTRL